MAAPKHTSAINITISAPGKIILHGEHSVVYGKLAVAASLNLRTKFNLTDLPQSQYDDLIILEFPNIQLFQSFLIQDIKRLILNTPIPAITHAFNFASPECINHPIFLEQIEKFVKLKANVSETKHVALVSFLYLYCAILGPSGAPLKPIKVVISSEISIGAGLGSSASFLVTIVGGLIEYVKGQYRLFKKNEKCNYNLDLDEAKPYSSEELHLISKWAFNAEKIIHGTPSGVDNTICTFGSVVKFRKGTNPEPLQLTHKLQVLLINTKVPKNTKTLVEKVAKFKQEHPAIVDSILQAMDEISQSAIHYLLQLSQISQENYEDICEKHAQMKDCYNKLEELADVNQSLLKALGVSHESLDLICAILNEHHLHGKLTGAGGGGYAIAVIPFDYNPKQMDDVVRKLISHNFEVINSELGGQGIVLH